jgi:hypothetical protein
MQGSFLRDGSTEATIHQKVDPLQAEHIMQAAVSRFHRWHNKKMQSTPTTLYPIIITFIEHEERWY